MKSGTHKKRTARGWSPDRTGPRWWLALLFTPSFLVCMYRLSGRLHSSSSCSGDDGGHLHINESCRSHAADPIYFSGTTDRQEWRGKASAGELPNYSKLQHFHLHIGPVRPETIVPLLFFFFLRRIFIPLFFFSCHRHCRCRCYRCCCCSAQPPPGLE